MYYINLSNLLGTYFYSKHDNLKYNILKFYYIHKYMIFNFRSLITVHYGVKHQKSYQNVMSILITETYLDQIKLKDFLEDMLKC